MPTASLAAQLDALADEVSRLSLEDIGEDGSVVANRLWRIATHLRNRSHRTVSHDVIRAWARLNGYHVGDTGRVPRSVVRDYYDDVLDLREGEKITD